MRRKRYEFRSEFFELEARMLLAGTPATTAAPEMTPAPDLPVSFETTTVDSWAEPIQVVTQQAGEATVKLSRPDAIGAQQVRVTTVPSPIVGVNVDEVDQTVTFADGQSEASVNVRIPSGAPNPGKVDVSLVVEPIDSSANVEDPGNTLDLRIVASDTRLPPKVVSAFTTSQGIVLSFNKPMNPVEASNTKNYAVGLVNFDEHTTGGLFGVFFKTTHTFVSVDPLRLQSAQYDPTTQSVTLILKNQNLFNGLWPLKLVLPAQTSVRPRHRSDVAQGLTDLQGNPINLDINPGKVELRLTRHTSSGGRGFLPIGPAAF
jgi:hypothetical protein